MACTIDVCGSIHVHLPVEGKRIFPGAIHRGDGGWRWVIRFDLCLLFFKWSIDYHDNRGMIKHTIRSENSLPVGRRHLNSVEIEHVIIQCHNCFKFRFSHGLESPLSEHVWSLGHRFPNSTSRIPWVAQIMPSATDKATSRQALMAICRSNHLK